MWRRGTPRTIDFVSFRFKPSSVRANHHDIAENNLHPQVEVLHEAAVQDEGGDIQCEGEDFGCRDMANSGIEPMRNFSHHF